MIDGWSVCIAVLLGASLLASAPADAQFGGVSPGQYFDLSPQDRIRLDALAREQARQDAKYRAEMNRC